MCYKYFVKFNEQRDIKNLKHLNEVRLSKLPPFCSQFFLGIAQTTSTLTRVNYAADLYVFFSFLKKEVEYFTKKDFTDINAADLNQVTISDLELYMSALSYYELDGKKHTNGEHGKMRKMATLRSFFKYLYRRGDITENVLTKVDLPKLHEKNIIRLDESEVSNMLKLSADNPRDNMMLSLFLLSGIRVSELVGLDYGDINLNEGTFLVTRKGGTKTILYMSDQLLEKFTDYLSAFNRPGKDTPLFQKCGHRLSVRAVEAIVKKYAAVAAPLKKISPHKLRSTYGTNLYRATGDIYVVADVLGHKDINTTKKHYAAISDDIRKKASNAVKI
jgi:site-specific recombinase XerD